MKEVVLFFPGTKWVGATGAMYPPLALIPIAGMLEEGGYKTEITDELLLGDENER